MKEEGVGGNIEIGAAEDLGVDLFEVGEGGAGSESVEEVEVGGGGGGGDSIGCI